MSFDQSVRGLVPGATIDLLGVDIGRVRTVTLDYDAKRKRFPVEVVADIFPMRLGPVRSALLRDVHGAGDTAVLQQLVANGLRAQLRTGNLLTGQLYVALDFIPGPSRTATIDDDGSVRMPTAPGTLSELQPQIAEIVQKVSKIPFDDIGRDLRTTLASASKAINQLSPEAQKALVELQRTSRALRLLSDYLQQHPEALLRGKPADAPVPQR
jgi:paraquat-inducible protein B